MVLVGRWLVGPLVEPIGLSPLHILTLCGSERVWLCQWSPWMTWGGVRVPGPRSAPPPPIGKSKQFRDTCMQPPQYC